MPNLSEMLPHIPEQRLRNLASRFYDPATGEFDLLTMQTELMEVFDETGDLQGQGQGQDDVQQDYKVISR